MDKERFFKLNKMQIIWLFGSDSQVAYDYMRKVNYKNTIFYSHRNVFVFDREAQKESEAQNLLLFKCNWLDADGEWHFKTGKDHKNGLLVKVTDLKYDDSDFKPYYYKPSGELVSQISDTEQSPKHDNADEVPKEKETEKIHSQEFRKALARMKDEGLKAEVFLDKVTNLWGFKFKSTVLIQPVFTVEPENIGWGFYQVQQGENLGVVDCYGQKVIAWNGHLKGDKIKLEPYSRFIFTKSGRKGVVDMEGKILLEPIHHEVKTWSKKNYRVSNGKHWALWSIKDTQTTDFKYDRIDAFRGGLTMVFVTNPANGKQSFRGYIDENGVEQDRIERPLDDKGEFIVQERFNKKGLIDKDGKIILKCYYEDILPWAGKAFRVKIRGKWGIVRPGDKSWVLDPEYDKIEELSDGISRVTSVRYSYFVDANGRFVSSKKVSKILARKAGLRRD